MNYAETFRRLAATFRLIEASDAADGTLYVERTGVEAARVVQAAFNAGLLLDALPRCALPDDVTVHDWDNIVAELHRLTPGIGDGVRRSDDELPADFNIPEGCGPSWGRTWTLVKDWRHRRMDYAAACEALAELVGGGAESDRPTPAAGDSTSVNSRMIDALQKRPESMDWTIRQWITHLGCKSPATVQGTEAWKQIMAMRESARVARVMQSGDKHRRRRK